MSDKKRLTLRGPVFNHSLRTGLDEVYVETDKETSELIIAEDEAGNQLGISLSKEGTLQVSGWDEDGEWIELVVRRPCTLEICPNPLSHTSEFPLNQFTKADRV